MLEEINNKLALDLNVRNTKEKLFYFTNIFVGILTHLFQNEKTARENIEETLLRLLEDTC